MAAGSEGVSVTEHDWHSADYVEAWINRDVTRDAERRQLLPAHAVIEAEQHGVLIKTCRSGEPGVLFVFKR